MRLKLTLNRTSKQRMLPMDYQYYISTWIYKVLRYADRDFARFLHEYGYGVGETKLYKLFCFGRLDFGKPTLWKEKKLFEIPDYEIGLQISFDTIDAASNFIKGLFMSQEFYLGDRFNGLDFKVISVEALPEPPFSETMYYRLLTPWVVGIKSESSNHPKYLSPLDGNFKTYALKHLVEKHNNTRINPSIVDGQLNMKIAGEFKRAGFVIKPGTVQETRVVGNLFDFELIAPLEIHKMIWGAGISEKSSVGFGWVELR